MPGVTVGTKCLNNKGSKFKSEELSNGTLDSGIHKMNETFKSSTSSKEATLPASGEKGKLSMSFITNSSKHTNVGHVLQDGEARSDDVSIQEDVLFSDMYLNDDVLAGLQSTGFNRPSPVQLQAIPTGRCGLDLIVQAKSGTGKTCVFTVLALEMVAASATTTQVLVIAPTREIAVQIAGVMRSVGRHIKGLKVEVFIGGTTVENPGVCHIAVGTPGRLHHMLTDAKLCGRNIRLLVLDEADQMLDSFRNEVQQIVAALPHSKQVVCASATYTPPLQELAKKLMRSPVHVTLGSKQLLAVTQYVHKLPYTGTSNQAFRSKLLHLKGMLGSTTFNQCLIFTNSIMKAESVCDSLKSDGWPVACLCGGQTQKQRLQALDDLVTHRCRVLVATDLAARGLDSPHVSLVVSLEAPPHPHTYLHRVGRAGRFGARGLSVVLAQQGDDWLYVQAIASMLDLNMLVLPEPSLQQLHKWKETLPHLTKEQLQQWASTTNRKLEAWKLDAVLPQVENSTLAIDTGAQSNAVALDENECISIKGSLNDKEAVADSKNDNVEIKDEIVDSPFTPVTTVITKEKSDQKVLRDSSNKKDDIVELLKETIGSSELIIFSRDKYVKELHTLEKEGSEALSEGVSGHSPLLRDLSLSEQRLVHNCLDTSDASRKARTAAADVAWSSVARDVCAELTARTRGEVTHLPVSNTTSSETVTREELLPANGLELVDGDDQIEKDDFSFHINVMKEEKKMNKKQEKKFAQLKLSSENNVELAVDNHAANVKKAAQKHSKADEYNEYYDWDYDQYYELYDSEESVERDEYGDPVYDRSRRPKKLTEPQQYNMYQGPYAGQHGYYSNKHHRSAAPHDAYGRGYLQSHSSDYYGYGHYSDTRNISRPRKTDCKRQSKSKLHKEDQSYYDSSENYLGNYPYQTKQEGDQLDAFQPVVLLDKSKELKVKNDPNVSAVKRKNDKVEKLAKSKVENVTDPEHGLQSLDGRGEPLNSDNRGERKGEDGRATVASHADNSDGIETDKSRPRRKCEHPGCSKSASSSSSSGESDNETEESESYVDGYHGGDYSHINDRRRSTRDFSRASHSKPKSSIRKGHCLGCCCRQYPDSLSYLSTLHQFSMMDSFVRAMGRASALVAQQMRRDQSLWQGPVHRVPPSGDQRRRRPNADKDAGASACDAPLFQQRHPGSGGQQRHDTDKSYTFADSIQDSNVIQKYEHQFSNRGIESNHQSSASDAVDGCSKPVVALSRKKGRKKEKAK